VTSSMLPCLPYGPSRCSKSRCGTCWRALARGSSTSDSPPPAAPTPCTRPRCYIRALAAAPGGFNLPLHRLSAALSLSLSLSRCRSRYSRPFKQHQQQQQQVLLFLLYFPEALYSLHFSKKNSSLRAPLYFLFFSRPQIFKALNKIAISSATQAPRTQSLAALVHRLAHPLTPPVALAAHPKFHLRVHTILAKLLTRVQNDEIEKAAGKPFASVHLPTVALALGDFFAAYPRRARGCEVQYEAVVSLVKRLVLHVGYPGLVAGIQAALPGAAGAGLVQALQRETGDVIVPVATGSGSFAGPAGSFAGQPELGGGGRASRASVEDRLAVLKQKMRNSREEPGTEEKTY